VDGSSVNVARGETVAALGRNGPGENVLLRLLIDLQKPDAGHIRHQVHEISALEGKPFNEIRKKIGLEGALYDSLTVEENVELPLNRHTALNAQKVFIGVILHRSYGRRTRQPAAAQVVAKKEDQQNCQPEEPRGGEKSGH
jgi:ABC-type transporter Mla maintaining outer membrane lipid asymmetry ATPase subunit MlaF